MEVEEKYSLKVEAREVIKEFKFAVKLIEVSKKLVNTDDYVRINIETKENSRFCIEITTRGFRIIGKELDIDNIPEENSTYYETLYALLDSVSPAYRNTFGEALAEKLKGLQNSADNT